MSKLKKLKKPDAPSTEIQMEEIRITPNLDKEGVKSVSEAFSRPKQYENMLRGAKEGLKWIIGEESLSEIGTDRTKKIQDRNKKGK